ncbi:MAG: hypothetical protein ACTIJJ_12435 [Galactobacter sp.]
MTSEEQPQEAPSSAPEEGVQDEVQETTSSSAEEVQEDTGDESSLVAKLRKENAAKRTAAKEAEERAVQAAADANAKVEAITAQRDDLARQLIEAQLGSQLSASAFWKLNDGPDSFFNDDGALDPGKIKAAVKTTIKDLGIDGPVVSTAGKAPDLKGFHGNTFQDGFRPNHLREISG